MSGSVVFATYQRISKLRRSYRGLWDTIQRARAFHTDDGDQSMITRSSKVISIDYETPTAGGISNFLKEVQSV